MNRAQRRRAARAATKARAGQPRASKQTRKDLERAAKHDLAIAGADGKVPVLATDRKGIGRTPAGLLVVQDRIER